jgi:hypothetical protein
MRAPGLGINPEPANNRHLALDLARTRYHRRRRPQSCGLDVGHPRHSALVARERSSVQCRQGGRTGDRVTRCGMTLSWSAGLTREDNRCYDTSDADNDEYSEALHGAAAGVELAVCKD